MTGAVEIAAGCASSDFFRAVFETAKKYIHYFLKIISHSGNASLAASCFHIYYAQQNSGRKKEKKTICELIFAVICKKNQK